MNKPTPSRLHRVLPAVVAVSFALTPLLNYVKDNIADVEWGEGTLLFLATAVVGFVLWAIGRLFAGDWRRGAIVAAVASLPFFQFKELLKWTTVEVSRTHPRLWIYGVTLLLLAVTGYLLRKLTPSRLETGLRYLAVVSLVFLLVTLVPIFSILNTQRGLGAEVKNQDLLAEPRPKLTGKQPDIYYIILDRYTGQVALEETYGFDNSKFLKGLEQRKFYVADKSFNNYPLTNGSVASSLGAGLLETKGPVKEAEGARPLYDLIRKPAVPAYLQDRGYEFVQVGSWWGPTASSDIADRNPKTAYEMELFRRTGHLRDLSGVFANTTMGPDLFEKLPTSSSTMFDNHAPVFYNQLEEMDALIDEESDTPKFVFAHFLMPHPPYVFDKDGGRTFPDGINGYHQYLRQLQFTNQKMTELVDHILAKNPDNPPIILLGADEGEYPSKSQPDAPDSAIRQKTNILNTYYFPDGDYSRLYPTITPVNSFRVVLNQFFGTDLALRQDVTHAIGAPNRYLFYVDVTERVHRKPGPPGSGNPAASTPDTAE